MTLDPARPLFLNDGTPVEYVDHTTYHVTVKIPSTSKVYPHPARRQAGSGSHIVTAHRESEVLIHNHAYRLTNEVSMTAIKTFRVGDRVEYTGDTTTSAKGKKGVILSFTTHVSDHARIQFDGNHQVRSYAFENLTLIARFAVGDRVQYVGHDSPSYHNKGGIITKIESETNIIVNFDGFGERGVMPENLTPPDPNHRVRYLPTIGTTRLFESVEAASTAWLDYHTDREPSVFQLNQELEGGLWKTKTVEVLDVTLPPKLKYFDMSMTPIAGPTKDASYVEVEIVGGIVTRLEVRHPS